MPSLIRAFLERCDDFAGTPVFYEVRKDHLHHYADFGLTFVKLGEEARVDLSRFTLEGGASSRFRQALRRVEKEKASFRIVPAPEAAALMPELRAISDLWLGGKASEKGFSLGFFDEQYLARFPLAVIERDGKILAFANIWMGPGREITDHSRVQVDRSREIESWAHVMTRIADAGCAVYAYSSNFYAGHAPQTARDAQAAVGQQPVSPDTLGTQMSLF